MIRGDLVKSITSSNEFKVAMGQVDVENDLSKVVIEQVIINIFTNTDVRKQIRKMFMDIIFEMKDDGYEISIRDARGALHTKIKMETNARTGTNHEEFSDADDVLFEDDVEELQKKLIELSESGEIKQTKNFE